MTYNKNNKFKNKEEKVALIKERQKETAIKSMKKLGLRPDIIRQFADNGTVYKSVDGKLLPLNESEKRTIQNNEIGDSEGLLYHVIENTMSFYGECYHFFNLLLVWPNGEEGFSGCVEMSPTSSGQKRFSIMAYCINLDIPNYSEKGPITVINNNNILKRIW